MAAAGEAPPNNGNVQGQFEDLLSLVLARSRGEVGNDDVENALSSIVAAHAPSSSSRGEADAGSTAQLNKDNITPDDGNYDDDSEDDAPWKASTLKDSAMKNNSEDTATKKVTVTIRKKKNNSERLKSLENIPLGKMSEKMLITFGDGPEPELDVISTSLLGCRKSLQRVILDARALRRYVVFLPDS